MKKIIIYGIDSTMIYFTEVNNGFIQDGMLCTNEHYRTDMYIEISSQKEFEEKAYDIASNHFDNFSIEVFFDDLMFNNTDQKLNYLYRPAIGQVYGDS